MLTSQLLIAASWALAVTAQRVIDDLSFGTHGTISHNSFSIPNWLVSGEGYTPQLLSDKVILTPPYGGNKRGALWAEHINTEHDWEVMFEFRVNGPDHGKGNLNMWYVKDTGAVFTSSIYAVGKFDGLALIVDQNHGVQKIRGFLNDGSVDFRHHQNVDGLAFGHCDYNYRNRGSPTKLRIKHTSGGLEVNVDGQPCFSTSKVTLPTEYHFGVTAASADPPDSIEIFHFETSTASASAVHESGGRPNIMKSNLAAAQVGRDASSSSTDSAYQNLEQRLNIIEKSLTGMLDEFHHRTRTEDSRYNEILQLLKSGHSAGGSAGGAGSGSIANLEKRLIHLDQSFNTLSKDMHNIFDHDEKFAKIHEQLEVTMDGMGHLPQVVHGYVERHTPRISFVVFSFMAFQSCCLALLLWQKYRKSTMPKKYL